MRKFFLSFLFVLSFSLIATAASKSSKVVSSIPLHYDHKEGDNKKNKQEKYDFSLFKFVTPKAIKQIDNDSLDKKQPDPTREGNLSEPTTHRQMPRCFLMFS